MTKLAGKADRLQRFKKAAALEPGSPQSLDALAGLQEEDLPEKAQPAVQALRDLAQLHAELDGRHGQQLHADHIRDLLQELDRVVEQPNLVHPLQVDLAGRLFLEGQPGQARQVLPQDTTGPQAAAQLRNIEVILAGQTDVTSWSARSALSPDPGASNVNSRGPPPVVLALVPVGDPSGPREPVLGSMVKGLPALVEEKPPTPPRDEAAPPELGKDLAATLKERLTNSQEQAQRDWDTEALGVRQEVRRAHKAWQAANSPPSPSTTTSGPTTKATDPETDEDRAFIAAVEKILGRRLTPDERYLAMQLRREGVTPEEAAVILRLAALDTGVSDRDPIPSGGHP